MIEIDVLPASNETKGADSILLRFGTFDYEAYSNEQTVILIDGGYQDTSEKIKKHLKDYYKTKIIDLLICTHPDADHINGLIKLLEDQTIIVKKALIHDPWKHKYTIHRKSRDNKTTPDLIETKLDDSLNSLDDLLTLLEKRKVEVIPPFAGTSEFNGIIKILGPSMPFYTEMATKFPGMPDHKPPFDNYDTKIVQYRNNMEHFLDEAETSARNLSSAIILFEHEGFRVLFTGDAGKEALDRAIEFANEKKINLKNLNYFQIPHHGSVKNLSKKITDLITSNKYFVSAPSKSEDHPSKLLLNYFQDILKKKVYHVSTNTLCLQHGVTGRNWSTASNEPIFEKVQILIKK
jgi:beta-lactamase superfamily II metal-dependent hydrolase